MRWCIAVIGLVVSAAGLNAAELRLLNGTPVNGELVSINEKEIIFKVDGKDVVTPVAQALLLELATPPKDPKDAKTYIDIELMDGSRFHCGKVSFKDKDVTAVLLSGQELKFPMAALRWVLNEAQDVTLREDWKALVAKKTNLDQLVLKSVSPAPGGGAPTAVLNSIQVTFGEADNTGGKITFTRPMRDKQDKALSEIHGMIFQRDVDPTTAPVLCKVYDSSANVVYASALTVAGDKVNAVTPSGVKMELTRAALARLDYTKGKLAYLSDWDEKKMRKPEVKSTSGLAEQPRRDKNLDDGPIRIEGVTYAKGLAIHSYTELIYELDGEYREFKAIIGVDDQVGGSEGMTIVQIDDVSTGTVKEIKRFEVSRKTRPPIDVTLNVQNVKSLRIRVMSPELLDLGHHVDLAEARVTK
jgi:hypothetical protein